MSTKKNDIWSGLLLTALGVILLLDSFNIRRLKFNPHDVPSSFYPRILAGMLVVLGLAIAIPALIRSLKAPKEQKQTSRLSAADAFARLKSNRVLMIIALLFLYALLINSLGFILTSFVFGVLATLVLAPDEKISAKNILIWAIVILVSVLIINLIFRRGFSLMLPTGIIG